MPSKGWDEARVREFADNTVINRLKAVPNVYSVVPFGGYRRQMQVTVDREKLASYKLSILDVKDAIDRFNVTRPGGTLTNGPDEAIVRVDSRAASPADILGYPIKTSQTNGAPRVVYVRDVAGVADTHFERRSAYHFLKERARQRGRSHSLNRGFGHPKPWREFGSGRARRDGSRARVGARKPWPHVRGRLRQRRFRGDTYSRTCGTNWAWRSC